MATLSPQPDGEDPAQPQARRSWISREDLLARLNEAQADPGLRDDLRRLAGESTDDLRPLR